MAITRAQQFRQMYQFGGGADASKDDFGGAKDFGGGGDNDRTRIQNERQEDIRQQQLRDLTRDFNQGDTSLDVRQQPRGLGNLASLILSGATDLPFTLFNKIRSSDYMTTTKPFVQPDDFGPANPKFLFPRMAQGPRTMDNVPEEEDEEEKKLEGLRLAFRAEGGIIDEETGRQMYGLGKLVKKATRAVKKVAKSPIGKAALLYGAGSLGMAGLGQFRAGTGIFSPTGFLKSKALPFLVGTGGRDAYMGSGPTKGILGAAGKFSPFKVITAASLLPLVGLGTGEESEEEAQAIIDQSGLDIDAIRESYLAEDQYRARRFKAEGGSMKEPVAKKTMPLLDMGGQEMDLRAEGGFVPIGHMEKADDVPARLSKNEFVFTADAVRNAGDGNVDKGAEVMYNMMKNLEAGGEVSEESQGLEGARRMFQTSQRLEEVL